MEFLIIAAIFLFIMQYSGRISVRKFVGDSEPYFKVLMEEDYEFLLKVKYGKDANVDESFGLRIRNGVVAIIAIMFVFVFSNLSFVNVLLAIIIGFVIFKLPYKKLERYYKNNLHHIDQMLPYYLKSLEILIQHYTIPVALRKSISTAPEIFVPGLKKMIERIEAGDSSVEPYMDFAKEYPVRDSMRMMRLLYRLGLGNQSNKQEQLVMFSRTVSTLQNKAREQKYKERLETMEGKTMTMLIVTGGGILVLLLFSMMQMINI